MSWHPAHEQWGATQMQNRFQRFAKRFMLPRRLSGLGRGARDWGERPRGSAPATSPPVNAFIRSDEFDLAAFKGQKVTFRRWDGQLGSRSSSPGPTCRCQCRRRKAFCTSTPRSIRSASTSRRANANSIYEACPIVAASIGRTMRMVRDANAIAMAIAATMGLMLRRRDRPRPTPSTFPTRRETRSPSRQRHVRGDEDHPGRPAPARHHADQGRQVSAVCASDEDTCAGARRGSREIVGDLPSGPGSRAAQHPSIGQPGLCRQRGRQSAHGDRSRPTRRCWPRSRSASSRKAWASAPTARP